jgi:hypothetical protein
VIDDASSDDDRGEELHDDGCEDDDERPACPRTGRDHRSAEPDVQGNDDHADGNQGDYPAVRSAPPPAQVGCHRAAR